MPKPHFAMSTLHSSTFLILPIEGEAKGGFFISYNTSSPQASTPESAECALRPKGDR